MQILIPASGVFDITRNTSGSWSPPTLIDANDGITRVSAAGLTNGTLHVQTVVPGFGLWDRTKSAAGAWSGATKLDAGETIFDVSGARMPNGDLRVQHAAFIG